VRNQILTVYPEKAVEGMDNVPGKACYYCRIAGVLNLKTKNDTDVAVNFQADLPAPYPGLISVLSGGYNQIAVEDNLHDFGYRGTVKIEQFGDLDAADARIKPDCPEYAGSIYIV
jgi:hypothetical protein